MSRMGERGGQRGRDAQRSAAVYDALVAAHVVCAVVGFGSVALSGVYGGLARRVAGDPRSAGGEPAEREEASRYFDSPGWAEWLVLPVPCLGAAALAVNPRKGDFGDAWVVGGIIAWVVAAVLLVQVVRPAEARIRKGVAALQSGRRLMWASVASDVLFVAALALMVTQPK